VDGLSAEEFATFAVGAKANCPVSKAITGTTVTLDASLA
jgi:osmotically inducible protein OsmC